MDFLWFRQKKLKRLFFDDIEMQTIELLHPISTMSLRPFISKVFLALGWENVPEDSYRYHFLNDILFYRQNVRVTVQQAVEMYHDMLRTLRYIYDAYGIDQVMDIAFIEAFYEEHDGDIDLPHTFAEDCFYRTHPTEQIQKAWIRELNGDLFEVSYRWNYGVDTLRAAIRTYDEKMAEQKEEDEPAACLYLLTPIEDAPEEYAPQFLMIRLPCQCEHIDHEHAEDSIARILPSTEDGLYAKICLTYQYDFDERGINVIYTSRWVVQMKVLCPMRTMRIDQYTQEFRCNGSNSPSNQTIEEHECIFEGTLDDFRAGNGIQGVPSMDLQSPAIREEMYHLITQRFDALGISV